MTKRLIRILLRSVLIIPITILFILSVSVVLLIRFSYWLFEISEGVYYTFKDMNKDFVGLYKSFWKTFLK